MLVACAAVRPLASVSTSALGEAVRLIGTIGGSGSKMSADESKGAGDTQDGPLVPQKSGTKLPITAPDSIMDPKEYGTCTYPIQEKLRFGVSRDLTVRIVQKNRHYAEHSGYWKTTNFFKEADRTGETFYDPSTGKRLFMAPRSRSWAAFVKESTNHGWPSFRDDEVDWENVRCLKNGECVSVDGAHLGHNLPDRHGNRYCINLVSAAGFPAEKAAATAEKAADASDEKK